MTTEHFHPRQGQGHENGEPAKDNSNPFGERPTAVVGQNTEYVPQPGSQTGERAVDDEPDFGQFDIPREQRPTFLTEPQTETETKPEKKKGRGKTIGAIVTGFVVGVGGVVAGAMGAFSKSDDHSGPAHNATPTAEAPAVAGSVPSSSEVAPSQPEKIDANTYVFTFEGKEYRGQSALVEAVGVDAEKYPTYKEAAPALIDRLNEWQNSGGEAKDLAQAENYQDGNGLHTGLAGVEADIQDIAWLNALTDGSASATDYMKELAHQHINNTSYRLKSIEGGDATPYERKIVIDQAGIGRNAGNNPGPYDGTVYIYNHEEDNAYPGTTMGKLRTQSPDGFDGITQAPYKGKPQVLYLELGKKQIETPDHRLKELVVIENIKSAEVTG